LGVGRRNRRGAATARDDAAGDHQHHRRPAPAWHVAAITGARAAQARGDVEVLSRAARSLRARDSRADRAARQRGRARQLQGGRR
jgi:hypothetical protein